MCDVREGPRKDLCLVEMLLLRGTELSMEAQRVEAVGFERRAEELGWSCKRRGRYPLVNVYGDLHERLTWRACDNLASSM